MVVAAGLLTASLSAHAVSFLGTWSGTLDDDSYPNTFPTATLSLVVQSQGQPFGDLLGGYILWRSSPTDLLGCGSYPCRSPWFGVTNGNGRGFDSLWLGSGTLSSDDNHLSGTFSGFGAGSDSGTWELTRNGDDHKGCSGVPEPGTLALLGAGFLGLAFTARRRTFARLRIRGSRHRD